MYGQSPSLTKDCINFAVLIKTAKKMNRVKSIISANSNGGISISPKETMNNMVKKFIK